MPTIFALDLSLHAGYAVLESTTEKLLDSGTIHLDGAVGADYGEFPWNYLDAANHQILTIVAKIHEVKPKVVVVEAVNRGKNRWSQLLLDFLHCLLLFKLKGYYPVTFIDSSEWRKVVGIKLSKDQVKNNRLVNEAKKKGITKKAAGVKGKIGKKHLAVDLANELFGLHLKLKNNDECEAQLLGWAFLKGAKHSDPKKGQ